MAVNGTIQLAYQNTAWFTANPTLVLLEGQHVYLSDGADEFLSAYVVGDSVTELQDLPWKGLSSNQTQLLSPDGNTNISAFDGQANIGVTDGVNSTILTVEPNGAKINDERIQTVNLDKSKNNFRLSLTTGLSVTTTDVVNASTIYCIPHDGNVISLYDGTNWNLYESNEFSLALATLTTGVYDVFCYANSGVPTLEFLAWTDDTTRATALTQLNGVDVKSGDSTRRYIGTFVNAGNKSATVTISNATPAVITYTGHGLTANAPVVFTTTGGLPNGIVAGTTYYVASLGTMTANTFNISATPGGALINTTTAGSGTHTCTVSTYTEDSEANRFLWNNNNQVAKRMYINENTASWTYTTATYRQSNANKLNQLNFVIGKNSIVSTEGTNRVSNTQALRNLSLSIGLDSITSPSQYTEISAFSQVASSSAYQYLNPKFLNMVTVGRHYLALLEFSEASGTSTWSNGGVKACKLTGLLLV